jgi:PPE-repeat protein
MPNSSVAFRQLSDQSVPGTLFGASNADLIGFYGVTTAVSRVGTVALGSGSSFASLSQSSGALASSIAIALNNLGLIACSTVAA